MSSSIPQESSDPRSKWFTHAWSITLPSYPGLRFIRGTPSLVPARLVLAMDPANNELQDSASKVWDEAAINDWKTRAQRRYESLNAKLNGMDVLVEVDGKVAGYGDIYEIESGTASVGIVLNKDVRGRGVGKAGIVVLVQLGWELGLTIVSGTMKKNAPMRNVMKSLGVAEVEKIVELPGRGVVAELDYQVEKESWTEVEMKVEFGEALSS